jgi:uncharacterized membrane protein
MMTAAVPQANPRTNSLAVVALVLGFLFPLTLAAIPLGHLARRQITRSGERGDGLAVAGLVLGYLGLAAVLVAVAVAVVALVWPR